MTGILTIGSPAASLLKKENGSMGNRVECAGANFKNNLKTGLKSGLVAGTGAGAVALTYKFPAVSKFVEKTASKLANTKIGQKVMKNVDNVASKLLKSETITKIKGLPTPVKLAAAIALPVVSAISFIGMKGMYNAGKIDQQYEDKANLSTTLKPDKDKK